MAKPSAIKRFWPRSSACGNLDGKLLEVWFVQTRRTRPGIGEGYCWCLFLTSRESHSICSKEGHDNGKDGKDGKDDKARAAAMATKLVEAGKLKTRYFTISSKAANLQRMVTEQAEWAWANNKDNVGQLTGAMQAMEAAVLETGAPEILQKDIKTLKSGTSQDDLAAKLNKFLAIENRIEALEAIQSRLVKMHDINLMTMGATGK